jgi:hypothetical protein
MKNDKITLMPVEGHRVDPSTLQAIAKILSQIKLTELFPDASRILVEVGCALPLGSSLLEGHKTWLESYFRKIETPHGLPRQDLGTTTPAGIVRVKVSAVRQWTEGMGSYYGFDGYFLSLLISLTENAIWDARGEPAK